MRLPSLDSLAAKTIVTFKRFPFAITAAITGSIYCILWVNLRYNLEESHYYYSNIIMSCYLGMLLFIAIQIYIERKKVKKYNCNLIETNGSCRTHLLLFFPAGKVYGY